jgi:sulfur-oxidizing protein SoxY
MSAIRYSPGRRRVLTATAALAVLPALASHAAAPPDLPATPELAQYLAGRTPQFGRLLLDVPRLADNGNAVPMKLTMSGPFAAGAHLLTIRLYSEKNPVPLMARFEYPSPSARVEIDSRIRLAGTQRVAAIAELANGELHAAVADIVVTIAACLDGT